MTYNKIALFSIFLPLLIAGCTLDIDASFYDDNSWELNAQIHYYGGVEQTLAQGQDFLCQLLLAEGIICDIINIPEGISEQSVVEAIFRELVAHYGTAQIAADWELISTGKGKGTIYEFHATGREWESFEQLIPGYIIVTPVAPDRVKLQVDLGEENVWASAFVQETIRVHGGEIFDANAPVLENNYAQWPNPNQLVIEMSPQSRLWKSVGDTVPWIIGGVVAVVVIVFGFWIYRRYKYY